LPGPNTFNLSGVALWSPVNLLRPFLTAENAKIA
jgi:hypothetical protein